jgi:ABC-type transport system involved in multi-copper enzyme maturation permease subunit
MFVPAVIGVFVGAPLIAHELESGTFRLAWTHGRSRRPDTTSARPD